MRLLLLAPVVLFSALPAAAQYEATLVADVWPGSRSSSPVRLTVYDGRLFFSAYDEESGEELRVYDAAAGEVALAADIHPSGYPYGSNLSYPTVYDGRLFLSANGGPTGRELWAYDAETGEATLIVDLRPGIDSSYPSQLEVYDGRLFFNAYGGWQIGEELWAFDVDTGEASLIADIHAAGSSYPQYLTVYDNRLFFNAEDGDTGWELWVHDAITNETTLAADVFSDTEGSFPRSLTIYDDRLFFSANDGIKGRELWAFDASIGEAVLAADLFPGNTNGFPNSSRPADLTVYDDRLFFRAANGTDGHKLWAYDAATGEASPVTGLDSTLYLGDDYNSQHLTVYDSRLFFHATNSSRGREWWYYDAATGIASLAADIRFGSGSSVGSGLSDAVAVYDGRLFFSADDGTHGHELWVLSPTPVTNEPSAALQPPRLHTLHPNPAQDRATVTFEATEAGPVRVEVLDVLGRRVALLTDGPVAAGEHTLTWEAGALPSGLYLVRLSVGDAVQTQRLTLAR